MPAGDHLAWKKCRLPLQQNNIKFNIIGAPFQRKAPQSMLIHFLQRFNILITATALFSLVERIVT